MTNDLKKKKGFTLIELLVVVAIISLLSSIVLSALSDARAQARDSQRISDMRALQSALELYYLDNGEYPDQSFFTSSCGGGFSEALEPLLDNGYISNIPTDPLNDGDYCYYYMSPTSILSGLQHCEELIEPYMLAFRTEVLEPNLPTVANESPDAYCVTNP